MLHRCLRTRGRGSGEERAAVAHAALRAGESFENVREQHGDEEISPLPDAMLPALKLREYIGPTALRAAEQLESGEVGEPVRSGIGLHVLAMADRRPSVTPPLEEIGYLGES